MVIHEVAPPYNTSKSKLDSRNCDFKYHVHETMYQSENENRISSDNEKLKMKKKYAKKRCFTSTLGGTDDSQVTKISKDDLEELRTVYKKCKAVMKKIEMKYGHLLNLDETEDRIKTPDLEDNNDFKCECTGKKKIVFDDDGKEITTETDLGSHICVKKLKRTRSMDHVFVNNVQVEYDNVQVEYDAPDLTLPDDIQSLANILHNPEIETTYRNKVIHKMKLLKQEFMDEIRFNKHMLIEKLKLDPDQVLDFKGTNLKTLPGYIVT